MQIPGSSRDHHNNWFGGVYQDEKNFFPQFAIDVDNQRQVFDELRVPDDQWANFVKDRRGAIVGAGLAKRFGLENRRPHPPQETPSSAGRYVGIQHRWHYHWEKRAQDDEISSGSSGTYFEERMPQRLRRAMLAGTP